MRRPARTSKTRRSGGPSRVKPEGDSRKRRSWGPMLSASRRPSPMPRVMRCLKSKQHIAALLAVHGGHADAPGITAELGIAAEEVAAMLAQMVAASALDYDQARGYTVGPRVRIEDQDERVRVIVSVPDYGEWEVGFPRHTL